jgi:hypothetical protein
LIGGGLTSCETEDDRMISFCHIIH